MVDARQFLDDWAFPILALVLAGGIGFLVKYTGNWLNAHATFLSAQTKQKIAALEMQALQEGADYIMAQAKATADKDGKFAVDGAVTRLGAQIALNHAAGVLSSHGLSPDEVANRILAKLPPIQVTTDTTGATLSSLASVQYQSP